MMLDEATAELLSRHVDGDLAASEEQQLQQLLAEQPALQQELASMLELRDAVRAFADQEEPPAELSKLLEPLRRSPPPPVTVRPFYRWLAAAAALCIGVTVAMEVARQNPEPQVVPPPGSQLVSPGSREPFKLHPLPTPKDGEELVGAIDHLLANPPPEEQLENPPPLEVMGPVERAPDAADVPVEELPDEDLAVEEDFAVAPQAEREPEPRQAAPLSSPEPALAAAPEQRAAAPHGRAQGRGAPPSLQEQAAASQDEEASAATARTPAKAHVEAEESELLQDGARRSRAAAAECVQVLVIGEQRLELACQPEHRPAPGSYPVELTIARGRIARIELLPSTAVGSEAEQLSHACSRFTGRTVTDMADGSYTGNLIIGAP